VSDLSAVFFLVLAADAVCVRRQRKGPARVLPKRYEQIRFSVFARLKLMQIVGYGP